MCSTWVTSVQRTVSSIMPVAFTALVTSSSIKGKVSSTRNPLPQCLSVDSTNSREQEIADLVATSRMLSLRRGAVTGPSDMSRSAYVLP